MPNELEIVQHPRISDVNMFIVAMEYRTPHLHRDFEINLILEGHLNLLSNNERYAGRPGDLFILNPNQSHELFTMGDIGATLLCLQISPRFFKGAFPNMEDIFFEQTKIEGWDTKDWLRECLGGFLTSGIAYMDHRPHYQLFCAAKFHELLYSLLENVPYHFLSAAEQQAIRRKVERIIRLLEFVDANYMHKINLRDFADAEGLSLNHMSYFVKENLNQTFQEYVTTVRYNQARKLLLTENKRLIDICLEAGFSDPRYLTKAFMEKAGTRPEEYRHKYASREDESSFHRSLHSSQKYYTDEEGVRILKYIEAYPI